MKGNFKKQLWISSGIILIAVAVTFSVMYFVSGDLTSQATKIVADKNLLAQQAAVVGILAQLKSDAPQSEQYEAAMNQLVPAHEDLISFPTQLQTLGQADNVVVVVTFTGVNVPATASELGTDGFSLTATGAASDLDTFFKDLETQSSVYLLSVDSFDFANSDSGYTLSVQGKVFSRAS